MRHLGLWLWLLSAVACSAPETKANTQIVISVATDYAVPEGLDAVGFRVEKQNGKGYDRPRHESIVSLVGKSAPKLPLTLALTSVDAGKPTVRVTVQGYRDGTMHVQRQAVVGFRAGQTLSLPMNLLTICEDVECKEGVTTCGDRGTCEPVGRSDLDTWSGEPPSLDSPNRMDAGDEAPTDGGGDGRTDGGGDGRADGGGEAMPDAEAPSYAIVGLSAGFRNSCAVMRSGHVYCWGGNDTRALGSDTVSADCPGQVFACSPDPRLVPGIDDAIQVGTGDGFSCALTRAGNVWCWGTNSNGQLGAGIDTGNSAPVRVRIMTSAGGATPILDGVDALGVARDHACARVAKTKGLVCWGGGMNQFNQIPIEGEGAFVAIETGINGGVERFALGHFHGCFTNAAGALSCWGWNASGQLGLDLATTRTAMPHQIFASKVTEFALGDAHTCAIVNGVIRCVGLAVGGQLGIGPVPDDFPDCYYGPCTIKPEAVDTTIKSEPLGLALGEFSTCARYADGRAACWGSNNAFQAGQTSTAQVESPTYVSDPQRVRLIAGFTAHVCVATESDEILCWGHNDQGQLGPNATIGTDTPAPSTVTIVDEP